MSQKLALKKCLFSPFLHEVTDTISEIHLKLLENDSVWRLLLASAISSMLWYNVLTLWWTASTTNEYDFILCLCGYTWRMYTLAFLFTEHYVNFQPMLFIAHYLNFKPTYLTIVNVRCSALCGLFVMRFRM